MDVGEAVVAALEAEGQLGVVDAEQVHEGGLEVVDAHGVFGDVVTEIIGFSVGGSGAHAGSGQPHGKAAGMVVASGVGGFPIALAGDAASEFATPDDESVLEEAALFEVAQEGGGGLVNVGAPALAPTAEAAVVIPIGMEELDEADVSFRHAAGEDAIGGVAAWASRIGPVHFEDVLGFVGKVGEFGDGGLHPVGHFVLADAGGNFGIAGVVEFEGVDFLEAVQHGAAQGAREAFWVVEVEDGFAGVSEFNALKAGGEEAGAPVIVVEGLVAGAEHFRDKNDVIGQVSVWGAEPVADPRADGGASGELMSCEQERHGGGMINLLGAHGLDEAEVIGDGADVGQPFADGGAALSPALEPCVGWHDELLLFGGH